MKQQDLAVAWRLLAALSFNPAMRTVGKSPFQSRFARFRRFRSTDYAYRRVRYFLTGAVAGPMKRAVLLASAQAAVIEKYSANMKHSRV